MEDRDLEDIAREWWAGDGADEAHDFVWDVSSTRLEEVPRVIRALVLAAPTPARRSFVGTSVVEGLMPFRGEPGPDRSFELLRQAGLDHDDLLAVLSGIYPELLADADLPGRLGDLLTAEEIAWLIDRQAPGRRDAL